MDENKVCYISCVNDAKQYKESRMYLERQCLPKGMQADFRVVEGASSMAAGYNAAMRSSDAKYKVYLHQDVCVVNKYAIAECIEIFKNDAACGLIGTVGCLKMPQDGMWWNTDEIVGVSAYTLGYDKFVLAEGAINDTLRDVQAVDGIFMMTQYDILWREDLFHGWHFYDISQSMEFIRKGYKVQIPLQCEVWCIHDTVEKDLTKEYHHWRNVFLQEYRNELEVSK